MKTQKEIEQLAETQCHTMESRFGFAWGYEQCQQDMAKDLKMHILVNEHDWSRNPQAQLRDFINSLNKQD